MHLRIRRMRGKWPEIFGDRAAEQGVSLGYIANHITDAFRAREVILPISQLDAQNTMTAQVFTDYSDRLPSERMSFFVGIISRIS